MRPSPRSTPTSPSPSRPTCSRSEREERARSGQHEYHGRFAPEVLSKALALRDGVCQAPGCLKPADQCDDDHREPWPAGSTSGENMWPLCRKHHNLKGHGLLRWVLSDDMSMQAEPSRHAPPDGAVSTVEHHLAGRIVDYVG